MDVGFAEVLLIVGVLLAAAAALSGFTGGTVLSISVLAVGAGSGWRWPAWSRSRSEDPGLIELIELALILTLLADGLMVEQELLRSAWRPPFRALAVALPLTIVILACRREAAVRRALRGSGRCCSAPCSRRPIPSSPPRSSRRPRRADDVKHTLNLESGLNDGLTLPIVLLLLILAQPGGGAGTEALQLLGEATAAVVFGALAGWLAGRLLAWHPAKAGAALREPLRPRHRPRRLRTR